MGFLASLAFKLSGIGSGIAAFLKSIPPKVWYAIGIVLALLFALLFAWHIHTGWEKAAHNSAYAEGVAAEKINTDAEIAKNAINLTSIRALEADLAAKNAESDARAKALADSKVASDADQARFAALRKADANKDETLKGIRDGALAKPTCKVPPALTDQLGGL